MYIHWCSCFCSSLCLKLVTAAVAVLCFFLIRVRITQFYSYFFQTFTQKQTTIMDDTFWTSTPALAESIPSISVIWILPSVWRQSLSFLLHQRWLKVSPAYLWSGSCQACEGKVSVSFYTSAGWKYPKHICDLDPAKHVKAKSQFPSTPVLAESIPSISVI